MASPIRNIPAPILAQEDSGSIFFWALVLVAFCVAAFFGVVMVKRWMVQRDPSVGAGFTLSELRQLHKAGQLSDEEFQKAKDMVMVAARKVDETKKPPGQPGLPVDRVQNKSDQ